MGNPAVVSGAFRYPGPGSFAALQGEVAGMSPSAARNDMGRFVGAIAGLDIGEWEELHTRTLDLSPLFVPYVGHAMWGENYRRGEFMAELKGVVLALSQRYDSPRELLIEVNHIISENLDSRSFITVTYAVIDRNRGTMAYCRAGHTPIIHLTEPGSGAARARVLTPSGMVLGLRIDGAEEKFAALLEEDRIDLRVGDVIVLYTDGITEAMNEDSDLFGEARLSRIVEEHGHLDSGELRERILREIEAFVGTADQHDDMTMILLKVEHVAAMAEAVAV